MNAQATKENFELVARQLGTEAAFIEKDWHVTQALLAISKIQDSNFQLVFSGGTALSKVHKTIQRFSEDIDFIVVPKNPVHSRKTRSHLKKSILKILKEVGFQIEPEQVIARNENQFFQIHLNYKTFFKTPQTIRPHIQIEMTVANTQMEPTSLPAASLLNQLSKSNPEVPSIACMPILENAANKLSALTWRIPDRIRRSQDDDPSVVRHIYDLAILKELVINKSKFATLVKHCIKNDNDRIKNKLSFKQLSIEKKFETLMSCLDSDPEYEKEYDLFVKGVCYTSDEDIPDFSTAVDKIRELISSIN